MHAVPLRKYDRGSQLKGHGCTLAVRTVRLSCVGSAVPLESLNIITCQNISMTNSDRRLCHISVASSRCAIDPLWAVVLSMELMCWGNIEGAVTISQKIQHWKMSIETLQQCSALDTLGGHTMN